MDSRRGSSTGLASASRPRAGVPVLVACLDIRRAASLFCGIGDDDSFSNQPAFHGPENRSLFSGGAAVVAGTPQVKRGITLASAASVPGAVCALAQSVTGAIVGCKHLLGRCVSLIDLQRYVDTDRVSNDGVPAIGRSLDDLAAALANE